MALLASSLAACVVLLIAAAAPPRQTRVVGAEREALQSGGAGGRRQAGNRTKIAFGVLAAATAALAVGPVGASAVLAMWWALRRSAPIRDRRRTARRIESELPDAIDLFVLVVAAGLTPRQAIIELADRAPPTVRPGFAAVVSRLERGAPLADALGALRQACGPGAVALADLVGSADRNGLPVAPVLEQLAAESRAARRRLDEAAARSLPVKLSFPLVVCTLPSFVLLAIIPAMLAALSSLGSAW